MESIRIAKLRDIDWTDMILKLKLQYIKDGNVEGEKTLNELLSKMGFKEQS